MAENKTRTPLAEPVESDVTTKSSILDGVQSTVSAVATRARRSNVVHPPVEHDDIPKTGVESAPSTATKSTPGGDVVAESSASVSTAPTSISDSGDSALEGIEQKDKVPIQSQTIHTIQENPEEDGSGNITSDTRIEDQAGPNDAPKSDSPQRLSSVPERSSVGSSKIAFTMTTKDPSPAFPSPITGAAPPRSSTLASHSSSSLKRTSTGSTQFSSNKAETGSDVSSHRTDSSLQDHTDYVAPDELLQKTSNEHLPNNVSSAEVFDRDESFRPAQSPRGADVAKSTAVSDTGVPRLQNRRDYTAGFSSDAKIAEKAQERPKKEHWTRRKLLYTGLALMAMATIALRPRLPPK